MKTNEEISCLHNENTKEYIASAKHDMEAWESRTSVRYTHTFIDPAGKTRYFDMIKTPIYKHNGEPHEMIVVGRDITDILKAEQLNKAIVNALNGASDLILIIDKAGIITFCNARFLDVFGYDCHEEIENKPISIIKSEEHSDSFYSDLWEHVKANKPWAGEITNKSRSGQIIPCFTTIIPIMNGLPEPIYYISVMKTV